MSKLSPKGDRNNDAMPLGRWGDGGMSRFTEKRDDGLADKVTWRLDEIAAMAMFLFSDSANWITGQVFVRCLWFGVPWRSLTGPSAPTVSSPSNQPNSFTLQVVDGGENHVRVPQLPYPQAVLDPKSMMDRIQAKI
jgi:peroxisomal 2,4-dienoyl-CoA reductase